MTTLTVEQFAGLVADWARRRDGQFKYNWPVKGGWEGWVQVDLTAYVLSTDPTVEILREQPIYTGPGMRTDLLLNTNLDTDAQLPVEIKAESFENREAGFIAEVLKDLTKLNDDRNANYSESTCMMLAIPFNEQSLANVEAIQMDGHRIFVRVYVGEVACTVAVYTEQGGWLPAKAVEGELASAGAARG